jgi:hypothetical protein
MHAEEIGCSARPAACHDDDLVQFPERVHESETHGSTIMAAICGSVMKRNSLNPEAPSTIAASIMSFGIACSADRSSSAISRVHSQTSDTTNPNSAVPGVVNLGMFGPCASCNK